MVFYHKDWKSKKNIDLASKRFWPQFAKWIKSTDDVFVNAGLAGVQWLDRFCDLLLLLTRYISLWFIGNKIKTERRKNHANVKLLNSDMLNWFMRRGNHSNMRFVTTVVKKGIWRNILKQFMKRKKTYQMWTSWIVTTFVIKKEHV